MYLSCSHSSRHNSFTIFQEIWQNAFILVVHNRSMRGHIMDFKVRCYFCIKNLKSYLYKLLSRKYRKVLFIVMTSTTHPTFNIYFAKKTFYSYHICLNPRWWFFSYEIFSYYKCSNIDSRFICSVWLRRHINI